MSFVSTYAKAAVFFVLGVLFTSIVVATTLYADAQFGAHRFPQAVSLRWVTERKELTPLASAFVVAKCSSTESVVTGGYDLTIGGAKPSDVYVLGATPEEGRNGYRVYAVNGSSTNNITVFSYAGCAAR